MGTKGFHHESKENQKKRSISNQIEHQTLTLEQRAVGTHLHRPTAGRPRAGQTRAARFVRARHRTLRRSSLRDAGVARAGLESVAPSTASSTAARSPSGERVRRRASRGGAVPPAPLGRRHHSVAAAAHEERRGENDLGFWMANGVAGVLIPRKRWTAVGSDPTAEKALRRRSGRIRPKREREGRRGGPIRRPGLWLSGLGPKRRRPSRPWANFCFWAA